MHSDEGGEEDEGSIEVKFLFWNRLHRQGLHVGWVLTEHHCCPIQTGEDGQKRTGKHSKMMGDEPVSRRGVNGNGASDILYVLWRRAGARKIVAPEAVPCCHFGCQMLENRKSRPVVDGRATIGPSRDKAWARRLPLSARATLR
jgi:hypothetical protein